jgi:hypothetical protein
MYQNNCPCIYLEFCYKSLTLARFNWTMCIKPHLKNSFAAHTKFSQWSLKHHISLVNVKAFDYGESSQRTDRVRMDRVCSLFLCAHAGMSRLGVLDIHTRDSTPYMHVKLCLSMLAKALPNLHTLKWTYKKYRGDVNGNLSSVGTPKTMSTKTARFTNVTHLDLYVFSDSLANMAYLLQFFPAVRSGSVILHPSDDKEEDRWAKNSEWNTLLQLIPEQARTQIHFRDVYPSNEYQTRFFETHFPASTRAWILNKDDNHGALVSLLQCGKWLQTANALDALLSVRSFILTGTLMRFLRTTNLRADLENVKRMFPNATTWEIARVNHTDLLQLLHEVGFLSRIEELSLSDIPTQLSLDSFAHAHSLKKLSLNCCSFSVTFIQHLRKLQQLTKLTWYSASRSYKFDELSQALLKERPCLIPCLQQFQCEQHDSDEENELMSDSEDEYIGTDDEAEDDEPTISDEEFIDDGGDD